MIRPHLLKALGDLAHARTSQKVLESAIVMEMEGGHRPLFRGHEWGRQHFAVIEAAGIAIQLAWDLMKWVQFPEVESRITDALDRLDEIRPALSRPEREARTSIGVPAPRQRPQSKVP